MDRRVLGPQPLLYRLTPGLTSPNRWRTSPAFSAHTTVRAQ